MPKEAICCKDVNCNDVNHIYSHEVFYSRVIEVLTKPKASEQLAVKRTAFKGQPGWNEQVGG